MKNPLARREPSQRERAADGSMTLIEHIRELRSRLFKASLGIIAGLMVGLYFAEPIQNFINAPYCDFKGDAICQFNSTSPVDPFLLQLKIGLYAGLIIASPIWLYQLWAFIAPGLHKHEKRYSYLFTAIAVPLFAMGAFLAFFVVTKSLVFFLEMSDTYEINVDLTGYFDFVTGVMMLFGFGFEFPLVLLMLNVAGVLTGKRMLGWWRVAVFLMFLFAAIVTPTPDPFGMSALALAMAVLYFIVVGVSMLNDKRRNRGKSIYEGLEDDETSSLDGYDTDSITPGERVEAVAPVASADPIERRYDDMT
ncbi:twin-arginine translocase subunit TatC [Catellatospora sichuanensis]|uniref:twin-arginine translocase subunit TatC n=1 Tax=Catellatospora sichuanensis TaxID=1969805 RepID=UPI001184281B|nr:twin-arginine translocase subunit TatC [Catellatospora sichuanensis]